jgi:hypothetical protein
MDVIAKAKAAAMAAGQKFTALTAWMALQTARIEQAKQRPIRVGPGKSSVLTLHRNLPNSKTYAAAPFSHPRREAWAKSRLKDTGTGYLGMRPGESARYFKRTGKIEVLAAPGRAL